MKIKEIKNKKDSYSIYEVTFIPNFIERLFNIKEKTKEYKDDGTTYTFGSQTAYVEKNGDRLGNGNWIAQEIDKWRRKF